ncbi:uncharacterized protein [Onthophagus taurus]|uniref:uncharacterized protein n=1 Tax=Onthophagus taurus TaxID=166361 RepID=UPI0039BE0105
MAIRPLSKELQAKAIAELNEDPKRIQDDINIIKEWLKQQRHLNPIMDDQFILTFLRGCKFSLEKTKNKFENLYTMRTLIPEFFDNRDPFLPELQALLKLGVILPLKPAGPDSPRYLLFRFFVADPAVHKMKNLFKLNMMIADTLLHEDDQITVGGMVGFQDASGITMSFLTHMDLTIMKKAMMFFEGAFPQRPKVMHVFNPPSVFDTMYNMMKPFMKDKMQRRMLMHRTSNLEEMYNHVPKSILPTEYGGDAGPIQNLIDEWKTKIESRAAWFKDDEKYRSDESKRVGKPKTESDLFGIEGSFRKLNVDYTFFLSNNTSIEFISALEGVIHFRIDLHNKMSVRPLCPELQAKAIAELNEDPKRIDDDIQALQDWLEKQRHLTPRMDKQFLLTFLRGCKFSLEKAKRKLENLYTMRTMLREFFDHRDPFAPEIQAILKAGLFLPFVKTEGPDSPRVCLMRQGDPAIYKMKDVFKVNIMISDILMNEDDQILIGGMVALQDMEGSGKFGMSHIDFPLMKKAMTFFDGAYPQRPKVMHFINIPSIFDTIYNMVKPFFKEKMIKRFVFHKTTNMDEIYKQIPKSILPTEYGGDAGPIQDLIDHWKAKVESYAEWFKEDEKYKSDESKRIGRPKTESDLFGIEGSFRKLNVD